MRAIYEVYAKVVDANGSYNTLTGYPKVYDSKSYDGDATKALNRARAEYHACLGSMYKIDTRQIQTVILMDAKGRWIACDSIGDFPVDEAQEVQE